MEPQQTFDDGDDIVSRAVGELAAAEREIARLEAVKIVQFSAAMRVALRRMSHRTRAVRERELALRSVAAEIAVAVRWSDRTVQQRLGEAVTMVDAFPRTLDALAAGSISARHAAVICDIGATLDDPVARAAFETRVLDRATTETVARTAAFARVIVEESHPEAVTARYAAAVQRRRVWIDDDVDGMARLGVLDDAVKIRAMYDRLTQQARAIRLAAAADASSAASAADGSRADGVDTSGDGTAIGVEAAVPAAQKDRRTIDQVRADLVCDLVLTGQPAIDPTTDVLPGGLGAIRAQVAITVPVLTAAGVEDRGAVIDGHSPVDPGTARLLMATAPGWDRVLTHPVTGTVLAVDRYRPTAQIIRFLSARDVHCRFPGCRQPTRRCDVDHTEEFARGGSTRADNLAFLCKRHHALKTETRWRAAQDADGNLHWTSPLGRRTIDRPASSVRFEPAQAPPSSTATVSGAATMSDARGSTRDDPPPF